MNEIADILRWVDENPSASRVVAGVSKLDRVENSGLPECRVAILRNQTLETMIPYLKLELYRSHVKPQVYLGDYDAVEQAVLDSESSLYTFKPGIIVLALRLENLARPLLYSFASLQPQSVSALTCDVLSRVESLLRAIRQRTSALILVHNFELPHYPSGGVLDSRSLTGQVNTIRRLNLDLVETVQGISGTYVIDVEHLVANAGRDHSLDSRLWHIARSPYTPVLQSRLASEYAKYVRALTGKNKKCLVLDCDNTLWGGIIGEDGLSGIKLGTTHPGSAYMDFQAAILDLYHRGILLAICSKNNEADAVEVFEKHPYTLLKMDHFVTTRINWTDKATNIRSIAASLNIGIDSLVFMDDSSVECDLVRQSIPEVLTVQMSGDPTTYRHVLQSLGVFDTLTLSDEDRRRTAMYRAEADRNQLKEQAGSLDEFLASLNMTFQIEPADDFSIPRIAQLTQKTNQFNLTTRRYSEEQIRALAQNPQWRVYYARLTDRFDDYGIIAVVLMDVRGDEASIDTFLMSCRTIGRGVEQAVIARVAADAVAMGASKLTGVYIPTAKNGMVAQFYPGQGFEPGEAENTWRLDLSGSLPSTPAWLKPTR